MKKLFTLLLLPSIAFAGKIGENYVGVELGSTNIDFGYSDNDPTNVATDANGFSWEISGNYNLYQPSAEKYGADLILSYFSASGDDSAKDNKTRTWNTDTDVSVFNVVLRPHYDIGGFKIFVDLGLFHQDLEQDIKITDSTNNTSINKVSGDSSEFLYGAGFELSSGKFVLTPSVAWAESPSVKTSDGDTFNGNDTLTFSIPVSYSYSQNIDITASFSSINNDDFTRTQGADWAKVKSESTSWGIGIDYKF
jgi:hypothetical protein